MMAFIDAILHALGDHVGRENCCELSFDAIGCHGRLSLHNTRAGITLGIVGVSVYGNIPVMSVLGQERT